MQVVILAGGYGTRLRSIVSDRPKCMALIEEKPFLEYQIKFLASQGLTNFIICSGYKHEHISKYFGNGEILSANVKYSVEKEPLGTGGAIKNALHLLENNFIVLNGDTICNLSYDSFMNFHDEKKAHVSMVLAKIANNSRYGTIITDNADSIISFSEKVQNSSNFFINAGIYLIEKNSIDWKAFPTNFSLEKELFPILLHKKRFFGFKSNGYFIDIGIPEDFTRFQKEIKSCTWLFKKDFNS
jgi:D-glycero-alpha-D-manno-heptose 1-phosphate guanylyltransferase